MQMKHRKLVLTLFVVFLTAGSVDIYFIYAAAIPRLFSNAAIKTASVPPQKEHLPIVSSPVSEKRVAAVMIPETGKSTSNSEKEMAHTDGVTDDRGSNMPETDVDTDNLEAEIAAGATAQPSVTTAPIEPTETTAAEADSTAEAPGYRLRQQQLPRAAAEHLPSVVPLRFGPNRTLLWKFEKKILREVAEIAKRYGNVGVLLIGHADSEEKNPDELSRERALKAKTFLEKEGVYPALIEIESLGAEQPATKGTSPTDRKMNRRVRVRFIMKEEM